MSECISCGPGTFNDYYNNTCISCVGNTYQVASSATSCLLCDFYFVSEASKVTCIDSFVIHSQHTLITVCCGSLLTFLYFVTTIYILVKRTEKTFYNASVNFLVMILFGLSFLSIAAIFFSVTQTKFYFVTRIWFFSFGYNFLFLSLLAKLYRLNTYFFYIYSLKL